MTQKLVIGLLVLTVIGAVAVGVHDSTRARDGNSEPLLADTSDVTTAESTPQIAADAVGPEWTSAVGRPRRVWVTDGPGAQQPAVSERYA